MQSKLPDYDPATTVVSDTVEIDAPASVVWQVLIDVENYGEWNPFCFEMTSTLEMGAPVHMKLNSYVMPGEVQPNLEYVCAREEERLISWELKYTDEFPYPARRDQIIEPIDDTRCRYWSTDAFLGENGKHVMLFCGPWVKRAFDDTARALKKRAETIYREQKVAA